MTRQIWRPMVLMWLTVFATVSVGWWAVPILGAVWGWLDRGPRTVAVVAIGAGCGWGVLLLRWAWRADLLAFAHTLGGVMHLPGWTLLAVTVLYGAALGASAAALAGAIRPARDEGTERTRGRPPR